MQLRRINQSVLSHYQNQGRRGERISTASSAIFNLFVVLVAVTVTTTVSLILMSTSPVATATAAAAASTGTGAPTLSTSTVAATAVPMECNTTSTQTKTIYFIRHAESDENRRIHSLKTAFTTLMKFGIPKTKDLIASCELLRIDQQIDSNVSTAGKEQISYMANILQETNFLQEHSIELLVHSPLLRAKETCRDMFHCIDRSKDDMDTTTDTTTGMRSTLLPPPPSSSSPVTHKIKEVIELDVLMEMTPTEWIVPSSLQVRMKQFEEWLAQRPENNIVCVGHSQYMKRLLSLPYKFHNCDIVQVQFHPNGSHAPTGTATENTDTTTISKWTNVTDVHLCRMVPPTPASSTPSSTSTD